ncbi:MAG: RluA family pseudouridine synthase [Peptococcaceae bacterium]|nr:RluA family pseudouridine synthase [Peptococcaceae bacterium]
MIRNALDFCVGEANLSISLSEQESGALAGKRLDVVLVSLSGLSRTQIQKLIQDGFAKINGRTVHPNHQLRPGDHVLLEIPETKPNIQPENIPLDIVYEDDNLLVVNKPQGMVVHPAVGAEEGTLVNALLNHTPNLSSLAGEMRPGIIHRLDKDTSGLLLIAKNDIVHKNLARQIESYTVERVYRAIIHGEFADSKVTVDAPIGRDPRDRRKMTVQHNNSRRAVTHVEVVGRFTGYTEVEAALETGRTHQIRVHLAWLGHPVVGDPFYGPSPPGGQLKGQLLHASRLGFVHPETGEHMVFVAEPPSAYQDFLDDLV